MAFSVRRVTRIAVEHRAWTIRAAGGLCGAWILCLAFGAQFVPATPIASAGAASLLVSQVNAVQGDIEDHAIFAREIKHDPLAATPGNQLLNGLRGKDVLLLFVESYGKVAVQGTSIAPGVDSVLASGDKRLAAAGFSARSAWMTSPTFGGISWLAHSTFQTGLWVDTPQRYEELLEHQRFTLTEAFERGGWRTVDDVPSDDRPWAPGKTFYHFDKLYNRRNVGYHGPKFAFAAMPDQYVMSALQRLELAKRHRRPVFAEVDLVSSHEPWTRIPRMVPWDQLGNGSIFARNTVDAGVGGLHVNGSVLIRGYQWLTRRACRLREVDPVHDERADLLRAALREQEHRPDRPRRSPAVVGGQRRRAEPRSPDLDHRSRSGGAQADLRVGVDERPQAEPKGAGLADERLPRSVPDSVRPASFDQRVAVMATASVNERPYTLLSCALSIDGYLGSAKLRRLELSNDADFDRVDAVRASCDAILVGAETVRQDNPRLLVRSQARRAARKARGIASSPIKVTVTRGAELDPGADFFASGDAEKLVYCASERVPGALARLGPVATVLDGGRSVDMRRLSEDLADRGVERLMVEGGGTVHTQFLTGNLVDELQLVVAPFFVGDSRAPRFVSDGLFPWNPDRRATLSEVRQIGDVVLLRYALSSRFQDE